MNQLIVEAFIALCEANKHKINRHDDGMPVRSGPYDYITCHHCGKHFSVVYGVSSTGVKRRCTMNKETHDHG